MSQRFSLMCGPECLKSNMLTVFVCNIKSWFSTMWKSCGESNKAPGSSACLFRAAMRTSALEALETRTEMVSLHKL